MPEQNELPRWAAEDPRWAKERDEMFHLALRLLEIILATAPREYQAKAALNICSALVPIHYNMVGTQVLKHGPAIILPPGKNSDAGPSPEAAASGPPL